MKKLLFFLSILLLSFSWRVDAQTCESIFPDAASNSNDSGGITLGNGSTIYNSPDNILDTRTLSVPNYNNLSCNGVICTKSNNVVPAGNPKSIPSGSNVTLNYQQTLSLAPGAYGNLLMNSESTLLLSPGDYTFSGTVSTGYLSAVRLSSDGSARIWAKDTISVANQSSIGVNSLSRHIFLYSEENVTLVSSSTVYAFIYANRDVSLNNQAQIFGGITARRNISMGSSSFVTYNLNKLALTDFGTFCTNTATLPTALAEYRLEATTWAGAANEVIDSSPSGFNGRAISYGGSYPGSSNTTPAISGDPGSCRYGIFNGASSGHLRIEDRNALDLPTSLTVGVWIYPTALPSGGGLHTIVSKDENFEFHLNSSGNIFWWWGGGSRSLATSGLNLALNTWHHVVITYQLGEQKIYINGVERAATNYNGNMTTNGDPLLIGTDWNFDSRNFVGRIDEVNLFREKLTALQVVGLMNRTHPCQNTPTLGSFDIDVGGGSASVCSPKQVTITARDSNNNVFTGYTGTVNIQTTTNHGDWSVVNGSVAPRFVAGANDSGQASFTFNASDAGQVQLNLSNQHAQTLRVRVTETFPNSGTFSLSSNLTFSANAFVVSFNDSLNDDVVAGRDHGFRVQMYRRDSTTGDCAVASNYAASSIKTWLVRHAQDPSGAAPNINAVTLPLTEPGAANVTYPFVSGASTFSLATTDVGRYTIYFKDDSSGFSDQPILGDSGTVIVRPFGFDVSVPGNPKGVTATGAVFGAAGQNFVADLRAVLWQAADDNNGDGMPDGHADGDASTGANLANNPAAIRFGQESPSEGSLLSAVLVAPSGGNDPGLGNGESSGDGRVVAGFSNGAIQSGNIYYPEVGAIELNARLLGTSYLGASAARTAKILGSTYVGRFTPASFSLTPVSVNEACSSFTYMEQPFDLSYRLTAQNGLASPQTTQNYQGTFAKLGTGLGSFDYAAKSLGVDLSSRVAGATNAISWVNGVGTVVVDPITFMRQANSSPDGPLNNLELGIAVTDADGVGLSSASLDLDVDGDSLGDHGLLGQTRQLFGRLYAKDAFGPESTNIPMFWQAEYFDGTQFVRNGSDSCTELAFSQINFVGATTAINAAAQSVAVTLGGVTSSFSFADPLGVQTCMTATGVGFCAGYAGRFYGATNAIVTFPVQINLANYPYLRFDWNGDGNYGDVSHPQFNINFASYRGHDRIIFWRERL
ncbi:LamG domain-containing protein [Simiduia curdlanivorans]|uniref:DUF6701 domain-containing protein n=1 Tax=Simiduia curdlanivorans TaxID=1492769 RepID=A0ABV8V3Y0_9GAMM|nr:LamG domain-containing protein [Simiduia curdlanivorans]MDN3640172.1 LamG domain-containing protein [Simiduia curdlanivorans]